MPQRETTAEAWANFVATLKPIFEPPLVWLLERLNRLFTR